MKWLVRQIDKLFDWLLSLSVFHGNLITAQRVEIDRIKKRRARFIYYISHSLIRKRRLSRSQGFTPPITNYKELSLAEPAYRCALKVLNGGVK